MTPRRRSRIATEKEEETTVAEVAREEEEEEEKETTATEVANRDEGNHQCPKPLHILLFLLTVTPTK